MKKFSQWVSSIADSGREFLASKTSNKSLDTPQALADFCLQLCSSKGEALGTAIAHEVVKHYQQLDSEQRLSFFTMLATDYGPDAEKIISCADNYRQHTDEAHYRALSEAIESRRVHLFKRINMAPNGTQTLIQMRLDLFSFIKENPDFKAIDTDLKHLMIAWFNRGFLILEQISWSTQAHILEKLIAYEAVHAMDGWDDLRRRLANDRRCFAFFHPALEDEPLIFVEVALTEGVATSVQTLLAEADSDQPTSEKADTAIFYSISNCQEGLRGISFGNFLIKQVVLELQHELPQLQNFATLSPIPGFMNWLRKERKSDSEWLTTEDKLTLTLLDTSTWQEQENQSESLKALLMRLGAHYLSNEKNGSLPLDPVARFHLGNGASIGQLNWLGDTSEKGIKQSAGLLVNYVYRLDKVEENHEAFVNNGEVFMATEVKKLLN